MNILFDIGHPAHAHLFRFVMDRLQQSGHRVIIASRKKDVLCALLNSFNLEHHIASSAGGNIISLAWERVIRFARVLLLARKHRCSVLAGTSEIIGPVSRLLGARSVVFEEDDRSVVPLFAMLAYPLAHAVVTPRCLGDQGVGDKQVTYESYHELAYLHPNVFRPDPNVLTKLRVGPDERYAIVRLSALAAHHDVGEAGLGAHLRDRVIERLAAQHKVFVSGEGVLPEHLLTYRFRLPPDEMHNALAFSSLVVCDSQTMAAEAAVLGVPSIRCSSFVGRLSYLEELEHKYQLTFGISPKEPERVLQKLEELLSCPAEHCLPPLLPALS